MHPITILFFRSVHRLHTSFLDEVLCPPDTGPSPEVLVVPRAAAHARDIADRCLARAPREATFLPRIIPFEGLLSDLVVRFGPGLAPLPRPASALLAEDLAQGAPSVWPWLASLAARGSVGPALADLHGRVEEAGQPRLRELGAPRGAELDRFLAAMSARIGALPGHRTRAALLGDLQRALARPDPALAAWLAQHPVVVLVGPRATSPLARGLLVALLRAWRHAGARVVLALPGTREDDAWDTPAFLGADPFHPLAARLQAISVDRPLRRHLFDELVAEGVARIAVLGRKGPVPVTPELPPPPAPPSLADRLAAGEPAPAEAVPAGLTLWRCPDEHAEVRALARAVKDAIREGTAPEACMVALADLPGRAGAVEAVFRDHGVPIAVDAGRPLAAAPVVTAVLRMMRLPLGPAGADPELLPAEDCAPGAQVEAGRSAREGGARSASGGNPAGVSPRWDAGEARAVEGAAGAPFDAESLLSFLESDLVWSPPPLQPRRMRRACRAAGVTGGSADAWRTPLEAWIRRRATEDREEEEALRRRLAHLGEEIQVVTRVQSWLTYLAQPATPEEYRFRLLETADRFRIPRRAARTPSGAVGHDDGLLAWGSLLSVLEAHAAAFTLVEPGPWPADVLARRFQEAISDARLEAASRLRGQVRVTVPDALEGPLPTRTWVAGLSRGVFPGPETDSFLVPRRIARTLGAPDGAAAARAFLSRALQEAHDDPDLRLVLSWPATRDGQPAPPAPALADLLSLPRVDGGTMEALAVEPAAPPEEPRAIRDVARLAARDPAWRAARPEAEATAWTWQAGIAAGRSAPDGFGAFDGMLPRPPRIPDPLRVTALEVYLRCPARAFFQVVLGLSGWEVFDPDLAPPQAGRLLHRVLERFLAAWGERPLEGLEGDDLERASHLLEGVLVEAVEEERAEGVVDGWLLDHRKARWGAGLEGAGPRGLLRLWLEAEATRDLGGRPVATEISFRDFPLGPTRLAGKADRLDRLSDGSLLVIDYKTGRAPTAAEIRAALVLQPVVYAEALAMAQGAGSGGAPRKAASVYQSLREPDEVKYQGWYGDPEIVGRCASASAARVAPGRAEGAAILAHATEAAWRWNRGIFHTTLATADEAGCDRCEYARICRVDPVRNALVDASAADVHRPRRIPSEEEA